MPLTKVTITGADDGVPHEELYALSERFPFVEWGILRSPKREGQPRYPSREWLDRLLDTLPSHVQLSMHLCGESARDTLAGKPLWVAGMFPHFQRIQINGFRETDELVTLLDGWSDFEWILQARGNQSLREAWRVSQRLSRSETRVSALWDASGGRGIRGSDWPKTGDFARGGDLPMGFAGGIGPGNVLEVLKEIGPREEPFWLDGESGFRTDDVFNLRLSAAALECAQPFVCA